MVVDAKQFVATLRTLYNCVHRENDPLFYEWSRKFESVLITLEGDYPTELTFKGLEEWSKGPYDDTLTTASEWFRRVLLTLPPGLVHRAFTRDVVIWIALHRNIEGLAPYVDYSVKSLGYERSDLELAKLLALRSTTRIDSDCVFLGYDLIQKLKNYEVELDLRFCKQGRTLSEKQQNGYKVVGKILKQPSDANEPPRLEQYDYSWPRVPHGELFWKFAPYLDAPLALYIVYRGYPQAVVSFVTDGSDRLFVKQLQGVRGAVVDADFKGVRQADGSLKLVSSWGIAPLLWKELLLWEVAQLGKSLGCSEIVLQCAQNNHWTKPYTDNKIHLPMDVATEIYDKLAERLDAYEDDYGNWGITIRRFERNLERILVQSEG